MVRDFLVKALNHGIGIVGREQNGRRFPEQPQAFVLHAQCLLGLVSLAVALAADREPADRPVVIVQERLRAALKPAVDPVAPPETKGQLAGSAQPHRSFPSVQSLRQVVRVERPLPARTHRVRGRQPGVLAPPAVLITDATVRGRQPDDLR